MPTPHSTKKIHGQHGCLHPHPVAVNTNRSTRGQCPLPQLDSSGRGGVTARPVVAESESGSSTGAPLQGPEGPGGLHPPPAVEMVNRPTSPWSEHIPATRNASFAATRFVHVNMPCVLHPPVLLVCWYASLVSQYSTSILLVYCSITGQPVLLCLGYTCIHDLSVWQAR